MTLEFKSAIINEVVKLIDFTRLAVICMSKDLSVGVLMDFYSELLTEKQRDTMDLYYNQDYSLAEIAQNLDISRQGVRDFIKRGEKQLYEFEEKLGMVEKYNTISKNVTQAEELLAGATSINLSERKAQILRLFSKIKETL